MNIFTWDSIGYSDLVFVSLARMQAGGCVDWLPSMRGRYCVHTAEHTDGHAGRRTKKVLLEFRDLQSQVVIDFDEHGICSGAGGVIFFERHTL